MTVTTEDSINERQPLLGSQTEVSGDVENPRDPPAVSPDSSRKGRDWRTIGWYTLLTILIVFTSAIFIKGFIDADDIEVGQSSCVDES